MGGVFLPARFLWEAKAFEKFDGSKDIRSWLFTLEDWAAVLYPCPVEGHPRPVGAFTEQPPNLLKGQFSEHSQGEYFFGGNCGNGTSGVRINSGGKRTLEPPVFCSC